MGDVGLAGILKTRRKRKAYSAFGKLTEDKITEEETMNTPEENGASRAEKSWRPEWSAVKRMIMRVFGGCDDEEPEVDTFVDLQREREDRLFDSYPLSSEFVYMGVVCRVREHHRYYRSLFNGVGGYIPGENFRISCDYVDKSGVIRRIDLDEATLEGLLDV